VDVSELVAAKERLIAEHGAWSAHNYQLVDDIYTFAPGMFDSAERRIRRTLQVVSDNATKPLDQLRILDLGSYEGGFAIEFALHGADVVATEVRDAHVAKLRFAKDALGLTNLEVVHDDVRNLDAAALGTFDVVLCLGLLYHLRSVDLVPFMTAMSSVCGRLMIVETQISLYDRETVPGAQRNYYGQRVREEAQYPGAAADSNDAFWLTKASLLNLLSDVGFTSVSDSLNPLVASMAEFIDHVTLIAVKGEAAVVRSMPEMNRVPAQAWPERLRRRGWPTQSRRYALAERLAARRGESVFNFFGGKREQAPR
jgi:hypothetical protein